MLTHLGHPDCLGKTCHVTTIDGTRIKATIEGVIFLEQSSQRKKLASSKKLICLQKLRFENKASEYRFTYYMEGFKESRKGHWVFGQYSLLLPAKDLKRLLAKARRLKWPGF